MKRILTMLAIFLATFSGVSLADSVTIFGPNTYTRSNGQSDLYEQTFNALPEEGVLRIKNGEPDNKGKNKHGVTSAVIILNGAKIFSPSDFKKKIYELEASVNLAAENTLGVELGGKPGTFLSVEIVQEIATPVIPVFSAEPQTISSGASSRLTWETYNAQYAYIDNGMGQVPLNGSITLSPEQTTVYTLTATGPDGSASAEVRILVLGNPEIPSEGTFGWRYQDHIPQDATIAQYDPKRFAVVTGLVQAASGTPLEGVSIAFHSHPEYGTVTTGQDGRFSVPVEGGGDMILAFQKEGYITVHRKIDVPWNDIAVCDTLKMIPQDPVSTEVTFDGNPNTVIAHSSSEVTDEFGTRSCTLVFEGGNRAYALDKDGNEMFELESITVRATEFATKDVMPARLPPNSGYTYCVELSADGIDDVVFEKPVITWVDNFLGFDVGMAVPVGYYDRSRGVWVPSDNGVVVKLLDGDGDGVVDALDATGDDLPDDLNQNDSYDDEVRGLEDPSRYVPGATFWRVAVSHFSPWDCNWPYGPPQDATPPNPDGLPDGDQQRDDDCKETISSFVEKRSRIFHEDIPIPGTDMTLHYASNRVEGYKTVIKVPASGDTVPESLKSIIVEVYVAGQKMTRTLDPLPNQMAEFEWNGLDFQGNPAGGIVDVHIRIGFLYDAVYYSPGDFSQAFAQAGGQVTGIRARQEIISWKEHKLTINGGKLEHGGIIAEGWTLSEQHQLDPTHPNTLLKGDGTRIESGIDVLTTVAGNGNWSYNGDGGPAIEASLRSSYGIATDSAGNLHIADWGNNRIRKVDTNGIITTVAGSGDYGFSGDGGPAIEASLSFPMGIAIDSAGNLYILDSDNNRVRKVDTNGIITTVAGNGNWSYNGDGGPAVEASLSSAASGIAIDSAGNLYISDTGNYCIRKVDTNGIITTVAGNGVAGFSGDGGPAVEASLGWAMGIAIDSAGNLYILDGSNHRVRKVDTNGIITTVAGSDDYGFSGDGGPAIEASLGYAVGIAIDSAENLYISDSSNHCIRRVDTGGIIATVAGNGIYGSIEDGVPAKKSPLGYPVGVAVDTAGNLYISDEANERILKVGVPHNLPIPSSASMETGDFTSVEEDGHGHILSKTGLHKKTVDVNTGVALRIFGYDQDERLISIADPSGNQTTIQRNAAGTPVSITSPDGLVTTLTMDGSDHLTGITYPDGSNYRFEYTTDGLMTMETEPNGNRFEHQFDANGRLTDVLDEEGGHWQFHRAVYEDGDVAVEVTSGEGNRTTYWDHLFSTGQFTSKIISANDAETHYERSSNGLTVNKQLPCGMSLNFSYDVDPLYKFKYIREMMETTPSGLSKTTLREKSYQDTNSDDLPDLISETVKVNGKTTLLQQNVLASNKTITSPEGRVVTTTYAPDTLLTSAVSIPGLFDTAYGYDAKGRLTSISNNTRQTSFTYNAQGFLGSVTDPENHTTTYAYDPVGRVTGISRPDGSSLGFTYDPNGNMTVLTNPADISHLFGYNKVNLSGAYQTPLSGTYTYHYNKDRRLVRTDFPSGYQIQNVYDKARLMQIRTPEGNIDFTYLCGTKVGAITKGAESIAYTYDGKLMTSETLAGTLNRTLSYGYNNDFNLQTFAYAGDTESYGYDDDGSLTESGIFTISRNVGNGLPERVTGGALDLTRTFNGYGEVAQEAYRVGAQAIGSWDLTRDNSGRIVQKSETIQGITSSYSYSYDSMGRLLTVTKDGTVVEEYQYDQNGLRISEINSLRGINERTFAYSDGDHLLSAGDVTYQYDVDGFLNTRTQEGEVTTYSYSSQGELLSVTLPNGTLIEYLHDPFGRRIAKKVNGVITEKYLWQGMTRLLAIYDGSDNLVMRFQYADGRMPNSMTLAGSTYYLAYNQVGSLRAVADASGNVVKRLDYDSYGNVISDTDPSFEIPFGFAGGLYDGDTGLVRFGYRDYDPDIGRWTAKDPIFFAGGDTDLYGYCLNDPVNLIDIKGNFWFEFGKGFSEHIGKTAWKSGKTPNLFEAIAAGFVEVIKLRNKPPEFDPWTPWPIEFFLEPYLDKKYLETLGDWLMPDESACFS
ncbi:RHS repeat-associated core domain protein [delta proteobacterium NaphS2]|nr:RHS repeat-associated core domain protein [delta proteobacterium NaphS2]